jgi:hypothetical protein
VFLFYAAIWICTYLEAVKDHFTVSLVTFFGLPGQMTLPDPLLALNLPLDQGCKVYLEIS